ncbi:sulfotransferase domain-containing protein [Stella sp.]|uniref:sulfotransferase domain-containing protein n=1 Tax=Stella sp. TaxID=2912054 RepID=UPI0035AD8E9D
MAGKSLLPPPPGAGIISSFPKSGRTWLRFMLSVYLDDLYGLQGAVDLHSMFRILPNNDDDALRGRHLYAFADRPEVPRVLCEHLLWRPFDPAVNPTVAIVRSPVDTLVSSYFMETRQRHQTDIELPAYLRSKRGVRRWIVYYNALLAERPPGIATWVSYEQLKQEPMATLGVVLDTFRIDRDPERMERAIAASAFDRMAALEEDQGFPGNPADPDDPQGRRMREGKVGAASRYLTPADEDFVRTTINETLHPAARERLRQLGCNL